MESCLVISCIFPVMNSSHLLTLVMATCFPIKLPISVSCYHLVIYSFLIRSVVHGDILNVFFHISVQLFIVT